jgi:gamma-glutamylcyclotransferase (GGCT)/AIG2-like uncharacterized protein YtfP
MMNFLFAYGTLKHLSTHPKMAYIMKGQLRLTKEGWAAAKFDEKGTVQGLLVVVGHTEWPGLDRQESPDYMRRLVGQLDQKPIFAYEYIQDDWDSLPIIGTGKWTPDMKRDMK